MRSIGRGAPCRPTRSTRPPRRVPAIAADGAWGAPLASITMSNPTPSVSSSSSSARSTPVAFAVSPAPSARAVASRSSSMSIATTRPSTARRAAPATMNEPMPPAPITATASPGPCATRESAWRATASGWVIAAASSSHASGTGWQIAAGDVTYSASPPSTWRPSVRYSAHRFVRLAEAPPAATARDSRARDDPVADAQRRRRHRRVRRRARRTRVRGRRPGGRERVRDPIPRRPCRRSPRGSPRARPLPAAGATRVRDVLDPDVVRPVEDGRPHAISTRSGP